MPIPEKLLDILCCPVSHEPLMPLGKKRLDRLNERIKAGGVLFVNDDAVDSAVSEALITRDGKVIYMIDDGIPVLLPERGIGTTQFEEF